MGNRLSFAERPLRNRVVAIEDLAQALIAVGCADKGTRKPMDVSVEQGKQMERTLEPRQLRPDRMGVQQAAPLICPFHADTRNQNCAQRIAASILYVCDCIAPNGSLSKAPILSPNVHNMRAVDVHTSNVPNFGHLFILFASADRKKSAVRELHMEKTQHTVVHTHINLRVSNFCTSALLE